MDNALLCTELSQQQQLNGYHLLSCQLPNEINQLMLLHQSLRFHGAEDIPITLFQTAQTPSGPSLFLSPKPLPTTLLNSESVYLKYNQNEQAQFDFSQQAPLVIVADEPFIANAFAVAKLRQQAKSASTVILIESETFPFQLKPARFWAPEMPDEAIGTSELLEDWGMVNRMASSNLIAGCFQGTLIELFSHWVGNQATLNEWQLCQFTNKQNATIFQSVFNDALNTK